MGLQNGRDLILQVGDGGTPESFATLAGLEERTFRFSAAGLDVTDTTSPGRWRQLGGQGSLHNLVADQRLRDAFLAQSLVNWQVTAPGLFTCTGPFLVTELAYLGREEAEAGWEVTLASAGALSLTAAGG